MSNSRLKALRGVDYSRSTKAKRAVKKTAQIKRQAQNRVVLACSYASICEFIKSRKPVDITNYHCNKKTNKAPTVRAKEKRRLGFKEPR